ncbi:MAG: hypothetical protein ACI4EA_03830 [Candidatus Ornithomonoglobus sp.]
MNKREMKTGILGYVPGFRTGAKWKMVISSIYYLFSLLCLSGGLWLFLFMLSLPFFVMNIATALRSKNKIYLIPSVIAFVVLVVSVVITPSSNSIDDAVSTVIPTDSAAYTTIPTEVVTPTPVPTAVPTLIPTSAIVEIPHRDGMIGISNKDISSLNSHFSVSSVRNDKTGHWKISSIASNIQFEEYAASYYDRYFTDDKQIHFIVNFALKTTSVVSCFGNILDVTVHEYIDGEEHDANILGGGTVLAEYFVYLDNGDIEWIQQ